MGRSIARCATVRELIRELRQLPGDTSARMKDGGATCPGVCVMREDCTDHVDIGSPYPVSGKQKVWVLIRRYEREGQAQQIEYRDMFVFAKWKSAIRKAVSLVRADLAKYGEGAAADAGIADMEMAFSGKSPRHLVQLTDADNVVYELHRRGVGG